MLKKILLTVFTVLAFTLGLVSASEKINLNTASAVQLELLSGIGPATAAAIVEYRESNGQFKSIDELKGVKGIGDKKLEKLAEKLTIDTE